MYVHMTCWISHIPRPRPISDQKSRHLGHAMAQVGEESYGCEEQDSVLKDVSEGGEGKAAWRKDRDRHMKTDECTNPDCPYTATLERSFPHALILCLPMG